MVLPRLLPRLDRLSGPGWLGAGFLYWLALVCALEPGNLAAASTPPPWLREVIRLLAAGALGAAATPAVLALAGAGNRARAVGVLALAFGLIIVSCLLEAWLLDGHALPSLHGIWQELAANFVLLVFGLSVSLGFVLLVRRDRAQPARLVFSERGRTLVIHPHDIEWIESQGNYQAIRACGVTHLVRQTLEDLEGRLDSDRFVRIHRRTIVAVSGVRTLAALSNGDAELTMADGQVLRVARGRRARLSEALARFA
ncbi:LytTR family DNA-binding domain-containing protein [Caulobacter endophyticus]|nr:LytTR family DNA-binding domain-containing protein [Caulobacter endophyticus]